ncbi:unnamed protein product [Paramecium pentaurelia]|uniref:Uncharacterized protein n=1 Tax=Paramecium pentaurelia TaxID=43138 RepID=A0A8S1TYI2_9CILI|nr:unnamed protein product [Paramecium pentaurelia]CAD8156694.1 unnamed protein product [Paramecium pentaurelia]
MKEMQNQEQLIKKYEEECLKLKNENSTLQNLLREANFNLQTHIDLLNKEKINKIQPKIRIQNRNIEPKNDQVSIQNSQLFQSNYKKQINYRNKCGHFLDISKIQQQVDFAIKVNTIAQCTRCQASLSSKLCLLVQDYGRSYFEIKNQIELSKLQQNLQMKLKNHEKLIKCSKNNCQFFCIWQNNQKVQFGSFTQQKNGFCPQCVEYIVIKQLYFLGQLEMDALFETHF